jgi:hypothetical protein
MLSWLVLSACAPPDEAPLPPAPDEGRPLSAAERGVRVSMAMRGIRPSFEELDALIADPDALPGLVEEWLTDPAFGETVRDLWNEALQVRADTEPLDATGSLAGYTLEEIHASIQEAPLRTIERIVLEDRPYTEIVTGGWGDADEVVSRAWTGYAPYDSAGEEWQPLPWTDGRPEAGVLSDSSLWLRWRSAGANAQRGRANLVARALLCEDFLERDASIDTSAVADPTAGSTALDSPSCAVCHQALDPLASFFPFTPYPAVVFLVFPVDMYDESWVSSQGWMQSTGEVPDYYGLGGETLADMAQLVAADPRFPRCLVERSWAFLHQREMRELPVAELDGLQSELVARGSLRDLVRGIVLDEGFARVTPESALRVRAEALPRLVEDLTGFRWTVDGQTMCCGTSNAELGDVHLGEDALRGWVMLWGGIDGPYVSHPTHASSTTSALVLQEYAAFAASRVVQDDLGEPDPSRRRLLRWVEADTTDTEAVRLQLQRLHLRVLGEILADDSAALDTSEELFFAALSASGSPTRAWAVVLSAMLSDERVEFY